MTDSLAAMAAQFDFDPAYGYDLDSLLRISGPTDTPEDFDEFWAGLYTDAMDVAVAPELGSLESEVDGTLVYGVTFASSGGIRLGGWLTLPADGDIVRGVVVNHGYGGRSEPATTLPIDRAAALFLCSRGQPDRSLHKDIPPIAFDHVIHGIDKRESYVHGGCAADIWCAATALTTLVPEAAARLDYIGGSFGGGIGALALPWDDRFSAARLDVPSFGHHPLRLTLPCTGSGEAVREYHRAHPEVIEVLRYFDAATAARRIRIPVLVAAALLDPAVPPPGQFAVHNALAGPKELLIQPAGHLDYPEAEADADRLFAASAAFFAQA